MTPLSLPSATLDDHGAGPWTCPAAGGAEGVSRHGQDPPKWRSPGVQGGPRVVPEGDAWERRPMPTSLLSHRDALEDRRFAYAASEVPIR